MMSQPLGYYLVIGYTWSAAWALSVQFRHAFDRLRGRDGLQWAEIAMIPPKMFARCFFWPYYAWLFAASVERRESR